MGTSSLTRKTLVNISLRVAGVVLISAGLSYLYGVSVLEAQVKQDLTKYITERGQRESNRFQLAKSNLALVKERFLLELKQPVSPSLNAEFNQIFLPWNDRTLRNFPQNRPASEFDTLRYPTASIGRTEQGNKAPITPELQHRIMTAYQLVGQYGAAWTKQFADLYHVSPENVNINYWHGLPLALTSPPELYQPKEEFFYVADPTHNPSRDNAWTGVYLDPSVKIWMVSSIMPIYEGDRFLGIFGHDIVLTALIDKAINDRQLGTTNMIFRADGRLIAHPDRMKEIQAAQGQLEINQDSDLHLQRIFQQVKAVSGETTVIDNPYDREFIAVTQLQGPDWYFVTVYPKSLLSGSAWATAKFVLLSGLVAMLIEISLIAAVLRKHIAKPLQQLTEASEKLASGNFAIQLDTSRQDELGNLAGSFNSMAGQLKTSFDRVEDANTALEAQVAELETTLKTLHETQAQMIQSEKMSALGNLVAGVAHEINNPIGFLNGSIKNAREYIQDLFEHLNLYQQKYSDVAAIEDHAEEIDLAFLSKDLPHLLSSMAGATLRIQDISTSLRVFSRADSEHKSSADIHEGLDSTLLILKYRLKANEHRPEIEVIRNYGELLTIECFPGQVNQVFMNILANAIDIFDETAQQSSFAKLKEHPQTITIQTALSEDDTAEIRIQDNGKGMPEAIQARIFDHLFTTKGVGKGTGLGLAIAHKIIVDKHGGSIKVNSEVGQGTEFVIRLPIA